MTKSPIDLEIKTACISYRCVRPETGKEKGAFRFSLTVITSKSIDEMQKVCVSEIPF